jgi:cytochrome c biogenesis protein CcdA/glutaredoxin
MKKLIFLASFIFFLFLPPVVFAKQKVELWLFWGQGCPHCAAEKPFLEELAKKYPQLEIKEFEVYYNKENQQLFEKVAKAYNTSAGGVPMTFVGKDFVLGFGTKETTGKQIEDLVKNCLSSSCPSPEEILNSSPTVGEKPTVTLVPSPVKSDICIHYFIQDRCLQCQNLEGFLQQIAQKYQIDFKVYNVSEDEESKAIYQKLQEFYGVSFAGFPMVFLGDSYLVGDQSIRQNIENIILRCQKQPCPCPVEQIKSTLKQMPKPGTFTPEEKEKIPLVLFGKVIQVSSRYSLLALGAILGLADGINPCMFSVLLFLLTYLLAIGSKKRAVKVGLVFVVGVFVIYFLFMAGMLNLITLIGVIQKIKMVVGILALLAGLVMIKDFFAYGKWFSLEIPESTKPAVEKLIKKGTIPSAILLAGLSSLVELPCTAGIPLVYTTLLAQRQVNHFAYLFWYNLFFVIPLLLIIAGVAFTWAQADKLEKWRLNFRKYMRLAAGAILVFLAIALLKGWM